MTTPMKADSSTAVLIPMRLSAYCNYGANRVTLNVTDLRDHAYLAPIPSIKVDELDKTHDIYESIRPPQWMKTDDPARKVPEREGIYLHWEIPTLYKTSKASSSSAPASKGPQSGDPDFPTIPDRYLVVRTVTRPSNNDAGSWGLRDAADADCKSMPGSDGNLSNSTVDAFYVDSTLIRQFGDLRTASVTDGFDTFFFEDVDVTSSPYPDVGDTAGAETTPAFLGKTTRPEDWRQLPSTVRRAQPLTAIRTGNPFFADFQPHNASVFSIFDPLELGEERGLYLREGYISYTVVGWHSILSDDPFVVQQGSTFNLQDMLATLNLDLNPTSLDLSSLDSVTAARSLCHGSLLNIYWDTTDYPKPPPTPADFIQATFTDSHPVAVGSNAIDALFGWIRANNDLGSEVTSIRNQLLKLQTWVMDVNDNLDSQLQAQDLLATNNFAPSHGGASSVWQFKVSSEALSNEANIPPISDVNFLWQLNIAARQYNSTVRELKFRQRQLFDAWWAFNSATSSDPNTQSQLVSHYSALVGSIKARIGLLKAVTKPAPTTLTSVPYEAVQDFPFYKQRDPTVLIAGACSKWLDPTNPRTTVRIDGQDSLTDWINASGPGARWTWDRMAIPNDYPLHPLDATTIYDHAQWFMDQAVQPAIIRLLAEGAKNALRQDSSSPVPSHYFGTADRWDTYNGWFPLYIEWEIEYFDIPFENWTFQPYGPESRWGYTIKDSYSIVPAPSNCRVLSGRAPVVPQTSTTLSAVLQQVFSRMSPDDLESIVPADQRQTFLQQIGQLDYLSTNMSGLTEQLQLRQQGTHILPFNTGNTSSTATLQVSPGALKVASVIGLVANDFTDMVDVAGTVRTGDPASTAALFTQGQFRFTKLNIIDRWGQVVEGVRHDAFLSNNSNDTYLQHVYPTALYPALGEQYSVASTTINGITVAKTPMPRSDSRNTFVQIPPCLNQPARLNFDFVAVDSVSKAWRNLLPHENPVLAYIVYNTANVSLQLFTSEGNFVSEYLVGAGTIAARPFPPITNPKATGDWNMDQLITALGQSGYAESLYNSIEGTAANIQSSPENAAQTMQSIMGRPLALVLFSASIELADIPATMAEVFPPVNPRTDGYIDLEEELSIKIGDKDNIFDGLYCLFETAVSTDNSTLSFDPIYSYTPQNRAQSLLPIPMKPYWRDPTLPITNQYSNAARVRPFAALIDPFTPVHAYTAILPVKQLSLPKWAISRGLSQVSSFYKVGPVVAASDVPPSNPHTYVSSTDPLFATKLPDETGTIAMPALGFADWAWMQPCVDDATQTTEYNICGIDLQPAGPQYDESPRTITEGYLLMRKPFGPQVTSQS